MPEEEVSLGELRRMFESWTIGNYPCLSHNEDVFVVEDDGYDDGDVTYEDIGTQTNWAAFKAGWDAAHRRA